MSNKRKLIKEHEVTPKNKTRLLGKRRKHESPTVESALATPPACSTPKGNYSDDSLSQDYSPSIDIDVGWNSKKRQTTRKRRNGTVSKFAESLAKEKFERTNWLRKPLLPQESKPGELSALEKFKLDVKKLKNGEIVSPKSSESKRTFTKQPQKENATRSFIFAKGSDDSDDEKEATLNTLIKKFKKNMTQLSQVNDKSYINCDARNFMFGSSVLSNICSVMFDSRTKSISFFDSGAKNLVEISDNLVRRLVFIREELITYILVNVTRNCWQQIQGALKLNLEEFGLNKRIFFMMNESGNKHTDVIKYLKDIFGVLKTEELNSGNSTLILKPYKEKLLSKLCQPELSGTKLILRYPKDGTGAYNINVSDYKTLQPPQYLNDAIINFFLKYFYREIIETEDYRKKIHIFDTFLYEKLYRIYEQETKDVNSLEKKHEIAERKAKNIYENIAEWDQKVDIFTKDFLFIPICFGEHWFLAVICYPNLKGRVLHRDTKEEIDPKVDKTSPVEQSCILIFDSLSLNRKHSTVLKLLRIYLTQSYIADNLKFDFKAIPDCIVKVPQQENGFDCGVFLLEYAVNFYKFPITDFRTPIKGLENWFDLDLTKNKRKEIKDLIDNLAMEYKQNTIKPPDIDFSFYDKLAMEFKHNTIKPPDIDFSSQLL